MIGRNILIALLVVLVTSSLGDAWVSHSQLSTRHRSCPSTGFSKLRSTQEVGSSSEIQMSNQEEDDDDDEYEYVEYDILTEPEFIKSEWLVGTVMDNNPNKIVETWVRLAYDEKGKAVAVWGDNSEGSWNFDVASQFLSFSKENLLGKQIWAGVVDDYYFTAGTVRGWNIFQPAAVVGQWQAKRLGIDPDEAGTAPWFETDEEEETPSSSDTKESDESS